MGPCRRGRPGRVGQMSIAFLFPGQGAQQPGMLHTLPAHPAVARTLEEVSAALGRDVRDLDTTLALQSTVSVQLALLTAGVSMARTFEAEGVEPATVAGLSAGAFGAAVTAGALDLGDAVRLLVLRGNAMAALYPCGYGIGAVVGLSEAQVADLIRPFPELWISGINAPLQIAIAGAVASIDKALDTALHRGARKAERLDVAAPSHCPLLQPVADRLEQSLRQVHLRPPRKTYVGNLPAHGLHTANEIARDLAQNIAHATRWFDASTVLRELGCRVFLEMPPGHILTKLAEETFPDVRAIASGATFWRTAMQSAIRASAE